MVSSKRKTGRAALSSMDRRVFCRFSIISPLGEYRFVAHFLVFYSNYQVFGDQRFTESALRSQDQLSASVEQGRRTWKATCGRLQGGIISVAAKRTIVCFLVFGLLGLVFEVFAGAVMKARAAVYMAVILAIEYVSRRVEGIEGVSGGRSA